MTTVEKILANFVLFTYQNTEKAQPPKMQVNLQFKLELNLRF